MKFLKYLSFYLFFECIVSIAIHFFAKPSGIMQSGIHDVIVNSKDWLELGIIYFKCIVSAPLAEELFFRGYLMKFLTLYLSPYTAIFLSAFFFSLCHFQRENVGNGYILFSIFLTGLFLGVCCYKSKNILYPIGLHAISNLAVFFIN